MIHLGQFLVADSSQPRNCSVMMPQTCSNLNQSNVVVHLRNWDGKYRVSSHAEHPLHNNMKNSSIGAYSTKNQPPPYSTIEKATTLIH